MGLLGNPNPNPKPKPKPNQVGVRPHMTQQLIERCRARGVEFIVAPYEADAQLAYLVLVS